MEKASPEELKELKEEVLESKKAEITKDAPIIFDGRQYSIRFPKKFIDEAQIDIENDFFKIILNVPEYSSGEKPTIIAKLIRKNEEKETI